MPDQLDDSTSPEKREVPGVFQQLTRRRVLQASALGLGGLGVLPLLAACGSSGGSPTSGASGGGGGSTASKPAKSGGSVTIVRAQDSVNMDKTTVFSNASLWVYQQIYENLVTMTPDGQGVKPWLAESYVVAPDNLSVTFKLRSGVKFSDGTPMTSADVKFSIDQSSATKGGWEFINSAINEITTPDPMTVVIATKYPWSPLLADLACPNNGVIPNNYGGKSSKDFYNAPIGTGPFMWDTWAKGSSLTLKKNPNYWQAGKPYLDSVTWKVVPDDNSRSIQLQGGQAQINENPPFSSLTQIKNTPGVGVTLFPSTRTDYILMNQTVKPYQDVHVRRAISYAIDREAMVKNILFGNGTVANSFMMPTVPFYDKNSPGIQYDMTQAKAEMAKSSVPNGFDTTFLANSGDTVDAAIAQILQASLKELGINMKIQNSDPSANHDLQTALKYDISHSYWTMDIADPDELSQFALDPTTGGHAFDTGFNDATIIDLVHQSQKEFDKTKRQDLYNQIQTLAAQSAFLAFLFYTPFPYSLSKKVQGFNVLPTGYYHMEDVSLG